MRTVVAPSGTVTFLFTDVEGSSGAWERFPEAMRAALAAHDAMCRNAINECGGYVFKTLGDGFCAAFGRTRSALETAIALQRALNAHEWPQEIGPLRVRAGIHCGTAVELEGDYFGPAVNRAARLMGIGHGGQILVSHAVAMLLRDEPVPGASLRPLGSHRLRDLAEPEDTFQVLADGLPSEFAPLASVDARPNNLPSHLTSFVGREREITELRDALAQSRLVTIAGPGGIGKTRLALQVAAEMLDLHPHGTWFVDLANVTDPNLIVHSVASAAGVREIPSEPLKSTLANAFSGKSVLLILDNSEQLLQATAALALELLGSLPNLRVLATSRQPFHVPGETVYRIGSVERDDAVALFRERAQAAESSLRFDEDAIERAREICAKLEGVPLAIELAAARVALLTLPELRDRLEQQLPLLTSRGAADDRHRTLRGTIEWSHRLLEPRERLFLGALSVFSGSFSFEACEAVAPRSDEECVDTLASLVDKSFVVADKRAAKARYRLLDAIREFAGGKEETAGERDLARERHFAFFCRLSARGFEPLTGNLLGEWLGTVEADLPNLRSALTLGFSERRPQTGEALRGLWRYWIVRRRVGEGRSWLSRYLDAFCEDDPVYPFNLRRSASLASIAGDHEAAASNARRALAIFSARGDAAGEAEALQTLAVAEHRRGETARASQLYEDASERFRAAGDRRGTIAVTTNGALLRILSGDLASAQDLLDRATSELQQYDDEDLRSTVAAIRGTLAFKRENAGEAEALFSGALETKRRIGNEYGAGEILNALTAVSLHRGDLEQAQRQTAEALQIALRIDSAPLVIESLETRAAVELARRRMDDALNAFALALSLRAKFAYAVRSTILAEETEKRLRETEARRLDERVRSATHADWQSAASAFASSPAL